MNSKPHRLRALYGYATGRVLHNSVSVSTSIERRAQNTAAHRLVGFPEQLHDDFFGNNPSSVGPLVAGNRKTIRVRVARCRFIRRRDHRGIVLVVISRVRPLDEVQVHVRHQMPHPRPTVN